MEKEFPRSTLEQLLFREIATNPDFIAKLAPMYDERWFASNTLRTMSGLLIKWWKRFGSIDGCGKDTFQGLVKHWNDTRLQESAKINVDKAILEYNSILASDLGKLPNDIRSEKIIGFIKKEALRNSLLESADDIDKDTDTVVDKVLDRLEAIKKIMLQEDDLGLEYANETVESSELDEHYDFLTNPAARIPTGWATIDEQTHGGFYKHEQFLGVFIAQPGLGKSIFLTNFAYNCLKQGLTVLVFSMEMSTNVYGRRFDSLVSDICIDELGLFADQLKEQTTKFYKEEHPSAKLFIKEYAPKAVSVRDFKAYIKKLKEQKNVTPDVVIVDYLNIVKSATAADNMFEDGLRASEELRALSLELKCPIVTAAQANTEGMDNKDIGLKNISQSRGIGMTADFAMALSQSDEDLDRGVIDGHIVKNRLGAKTSNHVLFKFDNTRLRISDVGISGGYEDRNKEINDLIADNGQSNLDELTLNEIDI